MNMFQFAIASIVDANTGNGLTHHHGPRDYAALEQHGLTIRAKSVAAVIGAIKSRLAASIDGYRQRSKQRRELGLLMQLNDHLLDDIGLFRGDLYSVGLGVKSLSELNVGRESVRNFNQVKLDRCAVTDNINQDSDAINEQFFDQEKCA